MDRDGEIVTRSATGNGPISALVAMYNDAGIDVRVLDYAEHALTEGGRLWLQRTLRPRSANVSYGVLTDYNTSTASLQAVTSLSIGTCVMKRLKKPLNKTPRNPVDRNLYCSKLPDPWDYSAYL